LKNGGTAASAKLYNRRSPEEASVTFRTIVMAAVKIKRERNHIMMKTKQAKNLVVHARR
jgi:hypothetical protein